VGESEQPESPPLGVQEAGDRIQVLLDASAAGGVVARERAEELVRVTADLYGAGLERLLDLLYGMGRLDDEVLAALAGDELVSSLLLVHGLHPYDVTTRVEQALESVRPYLGSHGGDVELLDVTPEGVVRLRLLGSCDGCPSSSVTLTLAVEGAVEAAAPEVTAIEVDTGGAGTNGTRPLIAVDSLRSRLDEPAMATGASWEPVAGMAALAPGAVAGFLVAGTPIVGCRVGTDLYAFRDRCPRCGAELSGAALSRRLGGTTGDVVLRCPGCGGHYDVRRAGAGLDDDAVHLDPLPLLASAGDVSVALPTSVTA
jgi:Fe-S cluster biogenesis protein NfuA/nitrite reductase/ring-hydroxylating ferredoxin subunit